MIRILVCGGRTFSNRVQMAMALDLLLKRYKTFELIHGAAPGADTLADEWGKAQGGMVRVRPFPADWKRLGRAAGPIRNQQMMDEARPNGVVAFPGHTGTADAISRAEAAGVPVWRPFG
jgi:hypothetical protein